MRDPLVRYRCVVFDSARWEGFSFREDDIIISTPAKCGTTWTQMIVALLIFQTPQLPRPLDELSPWVDIQIHKRDEVFAQLEAQTHRRFIKSHTPLDGLPMYDNVVYLGIGRDLRDVGFSWANHMANLNFDNFFKAREAAVGLDDLPELAPGGPPVFPESELGRFWMWVDDPTPVPAALATMAQSAHHLNTFWEARDAPNVMLLHYADMKADLAGQMRALAARLGIEVRESRWPELVEAASFERMKERADELAPEVDNRIWQDNNRFFHRGRSQWRELLDEKGLLRYADRVTSLDVDPDLLTWAHRGPIIE